MFCICSFSILFGILYSYIFHNIHVYLDVIFFCVCVKYQGYCQYWWNCDLSLLVMKNYFQVPTLLLDVWQMWTVQKHTKFMRQESHTKTLQLLSIYCIIFKTPTHLFSVEHYAIMQLELFNLYILGAFCLFDSFKIKYRKTTSNNI